ncbi:hypothetical protein AALP_AA2G078200 [Arabis alpina]|uniref:Uncharacterized protein n=1 Tax=Arabis alpina TaxID=50452 RepID=A0A087HFZ2_ARAAL|nr:hypothetical protein AALP_AA2G078200 [Arabis alpina]
MVSGQLLVPDPPGPPDTPDVSHRISIRAPPSISVSFLFF